MKILDLFFRRKPYQPCFRNKCILVKKINKLTKNYSNAEVIDVLTYIITDTLKQICSSLKTRTVDKN